MDSDSKALFAKARSLVAASDQMQHLAENPQNDPGFRREARRRDVASKALFAREMQQQRREVQAGRSKLRSDRVVEARGRRLKNESDVRQYKNMIRHASNALQRQLDTDPILSSAKASTHRREQSAVIGNTIGSSTAAGGKEYTGKGHTRGGDECIRRARNLVANVPR